MIPDHKDYFLTLAKSRMTTYEFSDKEVSDTDLMKILDAGRWAPSSSNTQPWQFLIIRDKKRIRNMIAHASYGGFHEDPPLIIALLIMKDCLAADHICVKAGVLGDKETLLCLGMCGLQMILEAKDLGISTCLLSPDVEVPKILELPDTHHCPLFIGLGYEKQNAFKKKRTRKDLKQLVFYESFGGKA